MFICRVVRRPFPSKAYVRVRLICLVGTGNAPVPFVFSKEY